MTNCTFVVQGVNEGDSTRVQCPENYNLKECVMVVLAKAFYRGLYSMTGEPGDFEEEGVQVVAQNKVLHMDASVASVIFSSPNPDLAGPQQILEEYFLVKQKVSNENGQTQKALLSRPGALDILRNVLCVFGVWGRAFSGNSFNVLSPSLPTCLWQATAGRRGP